MEKNKSFSYTYSASDREEVRKIRERYVKEDLTGIELLRTLDRRAGRRAVVFAITLGVISTLILGAGMSLCMTDIGGLLGIGSDTSLIVGIAIGVVGAVFASLAYPLYNAVLKREKEKIAPEILRLCDELLK